LPAKEFDRGGILGIEPLVYKGNEAFHDVLASVTEQQEKERRRAPILVQTTQIDTRETITAMSRICKWLRAVNVSVFSEARVTSIPGRRKPTFFDVNDKIST
jgi:hypothetical protein